MAQVVSLESNRMEIDLKFSGVGFRRQTDILTDINWRVEAGQRWVLMGRNGSGKTSLARISALYEHPTVGTVQLLGETLGRTDVRKLRRRIGFVSAAFQTLIRLDLRCDDFVMCGINGALEPWWHQYSPADRERAYESLGAVGAAHLGERPFGKLSSGEKQRAQIARALVTDPKILILDEPASGLDMCGREELVADLDELVGLTQILVTHHLEEIPASYDHALLLKSGVVSASGPIDQVITSELISECFDLGVVVNSRNGRYSATRKIVG